MPAAPKARPKGSGRGKTKRAASVKTPKPITVSGKLGLRAAIDRLRESEARAAAQYESLVKNGTDASELHWARKNWVELIEALRKVESSVTKVESDQKDVLPRAQVEEDVSEVIRIFRLGLESLPKQAPPRLANCEETVIQKELEGMIDEILIGIRKRAKGLIG